MQAKIGQYSFLFLGVLALSTSAIFVKLAAAPSSVTAFYRLLFAVLVLLPFALFNKNNRQQLLGLNKSQLGLGLISGAFLAIHYVLWFESLKYTSVASSTVIVTMQPLFAFLGCYLLFGERFSKKAVAGCFIALLGCVIIGWGDFKISGQALFGDFLAFVAAGIITAYFFVGQKMRKQIAVIPYSILGYGSSIVFLGIYTFVKNVSFTNYTLPTWWAFIGLGVISTILGQMIFNWLLKWLSTSVISMSILGETIGTCILAYFILQEAISWQQGIGITVTLAGLSLFLFSKNRV